MKEVEIVEKAEFMRKMNCADLKNGKENEEEGCVKMNVKRVLSKMHSCLVSFFNEKNLECVKHYCGRTGGGPPAKGGEGPRKAGIVAFIRRCVRLVESVVLLPGRFLECLLGRVYGWCYRHKLEAFALCFAAFMSILGYNVAVGKAPASGIVIAAPLFALLAAFYAVVLPTLYMCSEGHGVGLYVASSEDGFEAWLQTDESGAVYHPMELCDEA